MNFVILCFYQKTLKNAKKIFWNTKINLPIAENLVRLENRIYWANPKIRILCSLELKHTKRVQNCAGKLISQFSFKKVCKGFLKYLVLRIFMKFLWIKKLYVIKLIKLIHMESEFNETIFYEFSLQFKCLKFLQN